MDRIDLTSLLVFVIYLFAASCSGYSIATEDGGIKSACTNPPSSFIPDKSGIIDISDWSLFAIELESSYPHLEKLAVNKPSHFIVALFSIAFDGRITPSGRNVVNVNVPESFDSQDAIQILSTIKSLPDYPKEPGKRPQYNTVWNHVLEITGGITTDVIKGCSYFRKDSNKFELIISTDETSCIKMNRIILNSAKFEDLELAYSRIELKKVPHRTAAIDLNEFVWAEITGPDTAPIYEIESIQFID